MKDELRTTIPPRIENNGGPVYMIYDIPSLSERFYVELELAIFPDVGATFRFGFSGDLEFSKRNVYML